MKDYKGAIEDFSKAIELDPNFAEAYIARANAKNKIGDHKGGTKDWEEAERLKGGN